MTEKPLVVDTDPGLDDALALTYLWKHHDIELITTVAGNTELEHTTNNAAYLRSINDATTPIRKGADQPQRVPQVTTPFHGERGLASIDVRPVTVNDFHTEQLPDTPRILAIAPLTNIADMADAVPNSTACFVLGGTISQGNIHGEEFNFYADPHAANHVLQSHLDITLLPIDIAARHGIPIHEADNYHASNTDLQRIWDELRRASDNVQAPRVTPYDLLAAYLQHNEDAYNTKKKSASVNTTKAHRGHLSLAEGEQIDVVTKIDSDAMQNALKATLR